MACNKVKYGSKEIAEEYAEKYSEKGFKKQVPYYCGTHHAWHLTSMAANKVTYLQQNIHPQADYKELPADKKLDLLREWIDFWVTNRVHNELCHPSQKKSLHPFQEFCRQRFARMRRRMIQESDRIMHLDV